MVLLGRIELPTSPLPRVRSTTELQQRDAFGAGIPVGGPAGARYCPQGAQCQAALAPVASHWQGFTMSKKEPGATREERLAAKLRENLKKRKSQARALESEDKRALPKGPPKS